MQKRLLNIVDYYLRNLHAVKRALSIT